MKGALLLALTVGLASQDQSPRPRNLLQADRPLRANEIASVLTAVRAALASKAVRLVRSEDASGMSAREMVIGPSGVPHFERTRFSYDGGWVGGSVDGTPLSTHYHVDGVAIREFTGRRPQDCSGKPRDGELIVEYSNEGRGWTATAKTMRGLGDPAGAFDIVTGALVAEIGERGYVGGRIARALIAQWTAPPDAHAQPPILIGDPFPNVRGNPLRGAETTQKLWIDVDSLLPLQWETPVDAFAFRYDPTITITRPDGIVPPACVP